ncbi:hypothetical protein DIPPA_15366 [Diplonema papillatum]|nr:hypothetical protein DIPPA_15366 [Diplonema papillatum]
MQRGMRQAFRTGARGARFSSSKASSGDNSALMMFIGGCVFGAGALGVTSLSGSNDDKAVGDLKLKIAALEKQLNVAKANATKAEELRLLSEEYLQCTKGSEQLTGEMENMANRLKRTQSELLASRRRMDEVTQENEDYLSKLTDRIHATAQSGKPTSVSYVSDKGDLVTFKRKDDTIVVSVGSKEVGTLKKDLAYDKAAAAVKVGASSVVVPAERREIIVGQLKTLAETVGMSHNLAKSE